MGSQWPQSRLRDFAEVRVSNVDKKSHPAEDPVKLCNYMDVYGNDYVTSAIQFMTATASKSEIERFRLHDGDVVITKDSETPDDIGVPAVILESMDDLVCGYHLAIIRPCQERVHPVYLAKQIGSSRVARYFAIHASGSTRFGLPIGAIEHLEVPLPPMAEQSKIAEVLSTVDRAIGQTEALIAKQQRIKTGLMQDLLTRGIDEHGNLRSEETHEFKDSPLGRIPVGWSVKKLSDLAVVQRGKFTHRPRDDARFYGGVHPFIQTGDVAACVGRQLYSYTQTLSDKGTSVSKMFAKGTIAITIAANIADTAILGITMFFPDSVVGARVKDPNCIRFVEMAVRRWKPKLEQLAPKSAQSNINLQVLRPLLIATPTPQEQQQIAKVYENADAIQAATERALQKLCSLKTGILQDLLTGDRRVTPLLEAQATVIA